MGRVDPTALYFFKFGWGDIGKSKSSEIKAAYKLQIRASEINISNLRDNRPFFLESSN